jgi:protein gp37
MGVAARFSGPGLPYEGLAGMGNDGPHWTGKLLVVDEHMTDPIRWRRPRRIFVNSMSDLFHDSLSNEDIDRVFGVMHACEFMGRGAFQGHVFQVLTKRAERMADYLRQDRRQEWAKWAVHYGGGIDPDGLWDQIAMRKTLHPRIWLGVSVGNCAGRKRIRVLRETPAAVRFLSCEPLLEDLGGFFMTGIHWVIVGGESGAKARPMEAAWVRKLIRQCRQQGVACFVKQMGSNVVDRNDAGFNGEDDGGWHSAVEYGGQIRVEELDTGYQGAPVRIHLRDRKGGEMAEWPEDLRIREFPEVRP